MVACCGCPQGAWELGSQREDQDLSVAWGLDEKEEKKNKHRNKQKKNKKQKTNQKQKTNKKNKQKTNKKLKNNENKNKKIKKNNNKQKKKKLWWLVVVVPRGPGNQDPRERIRTSLQPGDLMVCCGCPQGAWEL